MQEPRQRRTGYHEPSSGSSTSTVRSDVTRDAGAAMLRVGVSEADVRASERA